MGLCFVNGNGNRQLNFFRFGITSDNNAVLSNTNVINHESNGSEVKSVILEYRLFLSEYL